MCHGWSLTHVHQPSNSWLPEIAQRVAWLLNIQRGFIEKINKKNTTTTKTWGYLRNCIYCILYLFIYSFINMSDWLKEEHTGRKALARRLAGAFFFLALKYAACSSICHDWNLIATLKIHTHKKKGCKKKRKTASNPRLSIKRQVFFVVFFPLYI